VHLFKTRRPLGGEGDRGEVLAGLENLFIGFDLLHKDPGDTKVEGTIEVVGCELLDKVLVDLLFLLVLLRLCDLLLGVTVCETLFVRFLSTLLSLLELRWRENLLVSCLLLPFPFRLLAIMSIPSHLALVFGVVSSFCGSTSCLNLSFTAK
jgi:hypothetical protein